MKKHRLPAHVKPFRYKIMLKPNLENFTFEGQEIIELVIDKPTRKITLHAAELKIESAEFIHNRKETWAGKITYNKEKETATFAFPKSVQKGKGELKLTFKGILNDKMRGFYKSRYDAFGVSKHMAVTQFEATDTRRAFPCFDEPSQKAIFDVTMMIPAHTTAISNTIESKVWEHESGLKVIEFEPTPQMSSYLLAFIVGEFEYIEAPLRQGFAGQGKRMVRVFTTPGKKEQARFALEVAVKCMEFYEKYFDIPYPLPVLDMIAIPDFAAGAMENWGAVTYRESTLLVDENRSSTGNKQWVALVIAHELAHQWFGNLVTMEWWTHLWLNEGFASFIEYLAIDDIFPEWDIWTQFVSNEMGVALQLDSLKNTHPIEVEVGHPAEISEIFDKVSYAKGSSILRMLYEYLGKEDFKNGLRHYLKKYAYANAQTEDLWDSLEEVSGKPVREVMKNWTTKAGHPVINVKIKNQKSKIELRQSRFFSSPISKKQSNDKTVWRIPLQVGDKKILMDKKTLIIVKSKHFEKVNTGEASFVQVDYPKTYLRRLEDAVRKRKLSPVDRLGLLRDTFSLAQSGGSPTTLALGLAQSYKDEENYTVWLEISAHLNQLDSLFAYESFFDAYRRYGRELYKGIAGKIGWGKKSGEKYTDSLLRAVVLARVGSYGDKETIAFAKRLFTKLQNEKIDPDLRAIVYQLVAENGEKTEFDTLLKMYRNEDNQQEIERIGRSLGRFNNKELLLKALEFAISKDVRFQNTLGIIASVWGNPMGRYLAWEFVKRNWKMFKERYAGSHYFTKVFGSAGEFTTKKDARDIEKFIKKHPMPETQRTIAQAVEQIYANAAWLVRDRKTLALMLKNW